MTDPMKTLVYVMVIVGALWVGVALILDSWPLMLCAAVIMSMSAIWAFFGAPREP